jgi:hypothetical protein
MKPLPPVCREFLLALDQPGPKADHAARCKECADHAAFRARVAPLLRAAPPVPDALRSPTLLEAIHERIVDAAERAPLGQLVANGAAPRAPETVWPEQLLDAALASAVRSAPPAPSPVQWNVVRRSILADVAARRVARVRLGVWVGLAGVAATALITGLVASRGTTEAVTIVITDLETAPGNEFAVLRYGAGAVR